MTISTWKQGFVAVPGITVSLLHKLMCPACWPAYAGIVSALGLGFLISTKYLLTLTVVFLAISVTALAFRSSGRRGLAPFWLGLVAAAAILIGKFGFESKYLTSTGISLLISASLWNSWPQRAQPGGCESCTPARMIDQKEIS
jgi:mercuric ion transport protein